MRHRRFWIFAIWLGLGASALADNPQSLLPSVPNDWKVDLVAEAPAILYPTAIVEAPDGTIYLGQDPMDMPGPPTTPIDSVLALRPDGTTTKFAEGLWAVMGLEWIEDSLYVMHAPYLSVFRDRDGDLKADERIDLVTGLGPELPGFSGLNDHVASGIRLGMDGFLYIAGGDQGFPEAFGRDGARIQLKVGGVVRVRPDGTDLQIVSTGERNPLSVMLTQTDDVFTYGNDDDSKRWPNSLTHHIVRGHYGYPYEFLLHPDRCLPVVAGQIGGAGAQGMIYKEAGLPERYQGNLFVCDWGLQTVFRYTVEPSGGSFRVTSKELFVTAGTVADFRPFSVGPTADGRGLYIVDWGIGNWLVATAKTGRLYRMTYQGTDVQKLPNYKTDLERLDHPAHSARLRAQHSLARKAGDSVDDLVGLLQDERSSTQSRLHAIWTLDQIQGERAEAALRSALDSSVPMVRAQAARRAGIRADQLSESALVDLLNDTEPLVRREAAIALGSIGLPTAVPALMEHLNDLDPFTAWSIRTAVRHLGVIDSDLIVDALKDPNRRDDVLELTDEFWSTGVAVGLATAADSVENPSVRARIVTNLGEILFKYSEWNGQWFGTNPLAGRMPQKTEHWDPEAMQVISSALVRALKDPDRTVRGRAIVGLRPIGKPTARIFRAQLDREQHGENLQALALILGDLGDLESAPALGRLAQNQSAPLIAREAAVDALGNLQGRPAWTPLFSLVFNRATPPELIGRAIPKLGEANVLPANDLASFLDHEDSDVRSAAVTTLAEMSKVPEHVQQRLLGLLEDPDTAVVIAAAEALVTLDYQPVIPKFLGMANAEIMDPRLRTIAIAGLTALPNLPSIPLYLDSLDNRNPELRKAAESALLQLGEAAYPAIEEYATSSSLSPNTAEAVSRLLTRFQPIISWNVIGPFARTTARVFLGEETIDFEQPHSGVEGREIRWESRTGEPGTGRLVIEDFKEGQGDFGGFGYDSNGSPDLAAFAVAEIDSPAARDAMLLIGSSGALIVELNGEVVHTFNEYSGRPFDPDSDRVRVQLRSGSNRLLIRTRQGIGTWALSVQVSQPEATFLVDPPRVNPIDVLASFALDHTGDPERGETLFFDPNGIGCAKCHAVNDRGTADIGPNLTGLASKYDRAEIIRSVLEPSERIATGYQPVVVATDDGRVLSGLVRDESGPDLVLADIDAKIRRIPKDEIEARRVGELSIMPVGLVEVLSPDDFSDLIAYLLSLKAPQSNSGADNR